MRLSDITPNRYPIHLLDACDSGLCLFGAGFYGANDAIHMHNAGLALTVVDTDKDKLLTMANMYPEQIMLEADVTKWVYQQAETWDIVSVDSPIAMFPWVLSNFDEIASLANDYLVITMNSRLHEETSYYTDHQEWDLMASMVRNPTALTALLVFGRASGGAA